MKVLISEKNFTRSGLERKNLVEIPHFTAILGIIYSVARFFVPPSGGPNEFTGDTLEDISIRDGKCKFGENTPSSPYSNGVIFLFFHLPYPEALSSLYFLYILSFPEVISFWGIARIRIRCYQIRPIRRRTVKRGLTQMLSSIEKALFLKTVNLFESMPPEQLKILTNISEEMSFQDGDILFNEGDPADNLYVIVDGEIEVIKNHGTPEEVRLASLKEKDSFGEMTLFGSEGRSATAIANGDSTFLAMRKEHLLMLIQENPAISTAIVFQLANMIRENNKQQSRLEKKQPEDLPQEPGTSELRRYVRFFVPGVVDIPALSDNPVALQNISAGGLLLSVARKPEVDGEFKISISLKEKNFRWDKATVARCEKSNDPNSPWAIGIKVNLPEIEQDELLRCLEENTSSS